MPRPAHTPRPVPWALGAVFFLSYLVHALASPMGGLPAWTLQSLLGRATGEGGFGLTAEQIGSFATAVALPWFIKPFLGMVTDAVPLLGYRRKGWLVLCESVAAAALLTIALDPSPTFSSLLVAATVASAGLSFADVIIDALMVEVSQRVDREQDLPPGTANKQMQVFQNLGGNLGAVVGMVFGGAAAAAAAYRAGHGIPAVGPVLLLVLVLLAVKEERRPLRWQDAKPGLAAAAVAAGYVAMVLLVERIPVGTWWDAVRPWRSFVNAVVTVALMLSLVRPSRLLYAPLVFLALWQAIPLDSASPASVQYWTHHNTAFLAAMAPGQGGLVDGVRQGAVAVGLLAEAPAADPARFAEFFYFSVLQLGVVGASLLALAAYRWWVALRFEQLIARGCAVLAVGLAILLTMTTRPAWTSPAWILLGFALLGSAWTVCTLAIMMIVPPLCPPGKEGVTFALFMSMNNLGGVVGGRLVQPRLYTAFAQVAQADVGGGSVAAVASQPHQGMSAVLLVCLAYLAALFLAARVLGPKWLPRRTALEPERAAA